jgi:hypothetical protein
VYQVLGLRKLQKMEPQKFELRLRDTENTQKGYFMRTEYGTEPELRARLKYAGMPDGDIERLFQQLP